MKMVKCLEIFTAAVVLLQVATVGNCCLQAANGRTFSEFKDNGRNVPRLFHRNQAIIPSYKFACCGQVKTWGFDMQPGGGMDERMPYTLAFQVWRPSTDVETSGCYTMIGENRYGSLAPVDSVIVVGSDRIAANNIISVQPGDVVGLYVESSHNDPAERGVALDASQRNEQLWYANLDDIDGASDSMCTYPVGTSRVLSRTTNIAPYITVSVSTSDCPTVVQTSTVEQPQPTSSKTVAGGTSVKSVHVYESIPAQTMQPTTTNLLPSKVHTGIVTDGIHDHTAHVQPVATTMSNALNPLPSISNTIHSVIDNNHHDHLAEHKTPSTTIAIDPRIQTNLNSNSANQGLWVLFGLGIIILILVLSTALVVIVVVKQKRKGKKTYPRDTNQAFELELLDRSTENYYATIGSRASTHAYELSETMADSTSSTPRIHIVEPSEYDDTIVVSSLNDSGGQENQYSVIEQSDMYEVVGNEAETEHTNSGQTPSCLQTSPNGDDFYHLIDGSLDTNQPQTASEPPTAHLNDANIGTNDTDFPMISNTAYTASIGAQSDPNAQTTDTNFQILSNTAYTASSPTIESDSVHMMSNTAYTTSTGDPNSESTDTDFPMTSNTAYTTCNDSVKNKSTESDFHMKSNTAYETRTEKDFQATDTDFQMMGNTAYTNSSGPKGIVSNAQPTDTEFNMSSNKAYKTSAQKASVSQDADYTYI